MKYISVCCNAEVKMSDPAPDFIADKNPEVGTCHFICIRCGKVCDVLEIEDTNIIANWYHKEAEDEKDR